MLALGALGGVFAFAILGIAGGRIWMWLFPRPDFRFEGTPALAGLLIGMYLGPALGVFTVAGRAGGRRLAAAGVTMVTWAIVVALWPHSIGPALGAVPGWVSVPGAIVGGIAATAGTGALAGKLVKGRS